MYSLKSSLSASNNVTDDEPVNFNLNSNSSATPTPTTTTTPGVTATPPTPADRKMPAAAGESSAPPSVMRMMNDGDTEATNFQPRQRHILAPEHDLESLEDDDDGDSDDDSEELRPGAFAVSQDDVTRQRKGTLTLATSTPDATSTSTTGESSECRPSQAVDSYTEDVQEAGEVPFFKSRLCRLVAVISLVIAIGLGVAIPLATSPELTPSPTSAEPTPSPTSAERLREFVEFLAPISERGLLEDPSTAQSKAVRWLANIDQADLDIGTMDNEVVLQERYLLALLYYSFVLRIFRESLDFLEESSVCSWNDGDLSGVFCDDGVHVSKIRICK
jgi:hypothetical protein